VEKAQLQITSAEGEVIAWFTIQQRGEGETTLEGRLLVPGSYFYTLILDGQLFETKQMVLTRG
jgi:hypothetical protein